MVVAEGSKFVPHHITFKREKFEVSMDIRELDCLVASKDLNLPF